LNALERKVGLTGGKRKRGEKHSIFNSQKFTVKNITNIQIFVHSRNDLGSQSLGLQTREVTILTNCKN
jgi:hypothetical protein